MRETTYRLWQMLLGWGFVGLIYSCSDRWQGAGYQLTPSWVDRAIPFSPHAVWLYLSFFLIIPLCYLLCPLSRIRWLRSTMQISALVAGVIYLLWPTTMDYPVDQGSSLSSVLLAALIHVDSSQNCLPSLHVALTALAVWAVLDSQKKLRSALLVLWGLAIAVSILQLRRHLWVDLLSGGALAMVVGYACQRVQWIGYGIRQGERQ
ncbi:PAP2 superfamily protein [Serratia fonticola]|jgi:membrane-associated phospholipid phosphatase|uniref:PAP2 superfamily protein n=1 Tax=Serratia fonticola TaxID=47917 RepID=A0A542D1K7_SERFO|nr:phosphatase PAP2 family protein [Serratia fonticola]TQI81020.1 PAP2 superfamily protein [Serratia fonticola]TQI96956.1 PAP2 superfamily protein [Serratia fonticola]TVZ71451.1 PAP2 superfamily protein [Serratia fonticola]